QTDLEREPLIPVDRVEVSGCPGVADQAGTVHHPRGLEQFGTSRHSCGERAHQSSPRTARVDATVHTGAPPSSAISVRVLTIEIPPRAVIESTCTTVCSRSPATMGRW